MQLFVIECDCIMSLINVQVQALFPAAGDQFYFQFLTQSFYSWGKFISIGSRMNVSAIN